MAWIAIITEVLKLFGPVLAEWFSKLLESLFKKAAERLPPPESFATPAAAQAALFDAALEHLPRRAPARRTLLRRLKAAAVSRALAKTPHVPLTPAEFVELNDAAQAAESE